MIRLLAQLQSSQADASAFLIEQPALDDYLCLKIVKGMIPQAIGPPELRVGNGKVNRDSVHAARQRNFFARGDGVVRQVIQN
jgi:hypothetical protein